MLYEFDAGSHGGVLNLQIIQDATQKSLCFRMLPQGSHLVCHEVSLIHEQCTQQTKELAQNELGSILEKGLLEDPVSCCLLYLTLSSEYLL